MKKEWLLPYGFKRIGWIILLPTLLLCTGLLVAYYGFDTNIDDSAKIIFGWLGLPVRTAGDEWTSNASHWIDNICICGVVVGSLFVGCSREKIEDEMIARIRLNALLMALWINYGILLVAALAVYDLQFIDVMMYNLFTTLVIFVAIFRFRLWRLQKQGNDEE